MLTNNRMMSWIDFFISYLLVPAGRAVNPQGVTQSISGRTFLINSFLYATTFQHCGT